jgi:HrpA-like RNA helicase
LIADGYDKVIVTQPRRLPCTSISERVNATMMTDTNPHTEKLAGWAVSGEERNPRAKIVYLTDGLLKERLLNDENFITDDINDNKSIVIFIDEVHERSVNIDLCLALIARKLHYNSALASKLKVIISSATLDSYVPALFDKIKHVKLAEFKLPSLKPLHHVKEINRANKNILDVVQEIYHKRARQDQILCFVNSVTEVNQCCTLLQKLSHNTIKAYPLIQSRGLQGTTFLQPVTCPLKIFVT